MRNFISGDFYIGCMGNSDIRDFASLEEIDYSEVSGETIAVDGNNWLYKYMTIFSRYNQPRLFKTDDGVKLPNLLGIPVGMKKFYKYNITPVFVFDGGVHEEKQDEIDERRESKRDAEKQQREASDSVEAAKYRARSQRITEEILQTTFELLKLYQMSFTVAPKSAEKQASYMCRESSVITKVLSDDYDALLFKSPYTLRQFTNSESFVEIMDYQETLSELELTHNQLLASAFLMGTDFNDGVHGIGPKTSIKKVADKSRGELEELLYEEGLSEETVYMLYDIFKLNTHVSGTFPEPKQLQEPRTDDILEYIESRITLTDRTESAVKYVYSVHDFGQSSIMDY